MSIRLHVHFRLSLHVGRVFTVALVGLLSQLCDLNSARAQWHTSTNADSALYVCPGFNQGILTFDDGSSIICGALSDSRYVQKLDPKGYNCWTQPVQLYDRPGTDNDGSANNLVRDGDGGVILWWVDFRGAFLEVDDVYSRYLNDAVYMQHVDKYGNSRWAEGGILIDSLRGGVKSGYGVSDGSGGIILYMFENLYDTTTGVLTGAHTWIVRYDNNGKMMWLTPIDTSRSVIYFGQPISLGGRLVIKTLTGLLFIDRSSGVVQTPPSYSPKGMLFTYKDSLGYDWTFEGYQHDSTGAIEERDGLTCVSSSWDSVWHVDFKITDEGDGNNVFSPTNTPWVMDQRGGVFYVWSYKSPNNTLKTRAHWITGQGLRWGAAGRQLTQNTCYATFGGPSRLGIYMENGTALAFDTAGTALWDTAVVVLSNPLDAYSPTIASDNNGGAIIAYWSTVGGIFAQHTGRAGKVGVTSSLPARAPIFSRFELSRNYPNPFNPATVIRGQWPVTSVVRLSVYDLLGREVAVLANGRFPAGSYSFTFDGSNLSSGVYFYRLSTGSSQITRSMMLLK